MKRWLLNRVRRCLWPLFRDLAVVQRLPAVDSAEPPPEFKDEDRAELKAFLTRDSGQRLLALLRYNTEVQRANAVAEEQKRVDHARGRAVGYREAIASLIVLSAPPPPKEETADQSASGEDQLRDQLSH